MNEDFLKQFNDPLMQDFDFTYKGKRYSVFGYWGISVIDENGNETDIDDDSLITKEDVLNAKLFDNNTKTLREIIPEMENVEFDF